MAERRMLTKKVTDDENFINLSSSAQALYLHLSMSADDDGFTRQISASMFKAHASVQDMEALLEKRYIYQFENGVIVIKHWRMANALRKDRYTPTAFQEELARLDIKDNGAYTLVSSRLPDGCQMVATGKDSIGKDSIENTKGKFVKPTIEEIQAYITENNLNVDAEYFFNYYESNGWMVGRTHMKKWKSAVQTWSKRETKSKNGNVTIQMPKFMEDQKNGVVIDDAPASEETLRRFNERMKK
jgi:hypothetical protein